MPPRAAIRAAAAAEWRQRLAKKTQADASLAGIRKTEKRSGHPQGSRLTQIRAGHPFSAGVGAPVPG